jgi:hypothetical protein
MQPHALDEYLSDLATTDGMPERPEHPSVPTPEDADVNVSDEPTT